MTVPLYPGSLALAVLVWAIGQPMFRMHGQFLFNLGSDNDFLAVHFEDKSKKVGRNWDLLYDLSQQGLNARVSYYSLNLMVRPDSEVIVPHRYEVVQRKSLGYKPQEIWSRDRKGPRSPTLNCVPSLKPKIIYRQRRARWYLIRKSFRATKPIQ